MRNLEVYLHCYLQAYLPFLKIGIVPRGFNLMAQESVGKGIRLRFKSKQEPVRVVVVIRVRIKLDLVA